MKNREDALIAIYERVKADRVSLGINTFKRTPTKPVDAYDYPCIFMHEGDDELVKASQRDALGYPAQRLLEVTIEIIASKKTDIKAMFRSVRNTILINPNVAPKCFVSEIRTEGPNGYGLPDVHGMRLVLAMQYIDDGT